MTFIDEKFALLEKAKRKMAKEEAERQLIEEEERDKKLLSLEQIREGIKAGELVLEGETLNFEEKWYWDNKLALIDIKNFFDEVTQNDDAIVMANNHKGICVVGTYLREQIPYLPLEEKQKKMMEKFKKAQIYVEFIKTVELEYLDYLCYRTPTKEGWVYNIIAWFNKEESRIILNFNCLDKERSIYGTLLEGILLESNDLFQRR